MKAVRILGFAVSLGMAMACGSGESADNEGGTSGSAGKLNSGGKGGTGGSSGGTGASGSGGSLAGAGIGGSAGQAQGGGGGTDPDDPLFGDKELCDDGLDNNRDGKVDEGCDCTPGTTEPCYLGKPSELGPGSACKSGTHTCISKGGEFGEWGPCEGSVLPTSQESCNGVDDNCNNKTDEGCECIPGDKAPCGPDIPPCKPGEKTCTAEGKWGECVGGVKPKPEVCNAKDDNCDGLVDNTDACECVPGTIEKCGPQAGTCTVQGDKICDAQGKWGPCIGGTQPDPEVCDGVDNDCDGEVDEESADGKPCECVPGTQATCGKKDGECKPGVQVCQAGGVWSECVGAVLPKKESCNGKDDDCNGLVDDGLQCECLDGTSQPCEGNKVGTCNPGVVTCINGKLTKCEGAVGPTSEVCGDGLDNDCDGVVDNGCKKDIVVDLSVNGDCVCSPPCPPEAPFPVGCQINFDGGNPNGCVAKAGAKIYFQEGVKCDAGKLSGKLFCSSEPGPGLNAQNCPINKPQKTYGNKPSDCAQITGGKPASCYF